MQGQRTTFSRVFRGSSRISTNLCVISNTLCVLHCQKNNQNAAEHSQKSPVAARENGILTSLCSFWVCAGPVRSSDRGHFHPLARLRVALQGTVEPESLSPLGPMSWPAQEDK